MSSESKVVHTNTQETMDPEEALRKLEIQKERARERQRKYHQRKKQKAAEQEQELHQLRQKIKEWEPRIAFLDWIYQEYAGEYDAMMEQYQDELKRNQT